MHTITLTESAIIKLKDIVAEENNPSTKFRVFVQGGGCSWFQYGFTLDDTQNEDDFVVHTSDGLTVLVDSMSIQYLNNAEIDYIEELIGSSFRVNNPGAISTCGCGSSFSV